MRNTTDPFRNDTSRFCCDQRCAQGRDCPVVDRLSANDDEISDRRYYAKFALWIAVGALGLWAVLDPMGLLALIERAMS